MANKFQIFTLSLLLFAQPAYSVPATGQKVMISAASRLAVDYGKELAKKGGNVIDVAVGVGLMMAVTNPYFASLGGGGFALYKVGGTIEAIDFREAAPAKSYPDFFENKSKDASIMGGAAVGVPGMLMGYWELHKKHGKLSWSEILSGPVKLAKNGFDVTNELNVKINDFVGKFNPYGYIHFFKESRVAYKAGETLKQPKLGEALSLIARNGIKPFYNGVISSDVVEAVQKSGGVISLDDLKAYKVRWLKPLTTNFYNYTVYMMPPPSSGGVVMTAALKLMELQNLKEQKPLGIQEIHLFAEIFNRSFRGRSLLGDPAYHSNPIEELLSTGNILSLSNTISRDKKIQLQPIESKNKKEAPESTETTHFSVMMSNGDTVSATITLNGPFGSGVVTKKYGIALNNEMDDFTTRPKEPNIYGLIQGEGNKVEPGKRPLSSMSPTIVEKNGKAILALGAQGGPRIISSVIQVLYRVLVNNYNIEEAIHAPRIHAQFLPAILYLDQKRWTPETIEGLKAKGHQVEESWMGRVYGVYLNDKNLLEGGFDNRVEGAAGGF